MGCAVWLNLMNYAQNRVFPSLLEMFPDTAFPAVFGFHTAVNLASLLFSIFANLSEAAEDPKHPENYLEREEEITPVFEV